MRKEEIKFLILEDKKEGQKGWLFRVQQGLRTVEERGRSRTERRRKEKEQRTSKTQDTRYKRQKQETRECEVQQQAKPNKAR